MNTFMDAATQKFSITPGSPVKTHDVTTRAVKKNHNIYKNTRKLKWYKDVKMIFKKQNEKTKSTAKRNEIKM